MVSDDGDLRAAAVGGVVRAAGLCGTYRLTVRRGARSRGGGEGHTTSCAPSC